MNAEAPELSGPCPACEQAREAANQRRALDKPELYIPGEWVCPTCGFSVRKSFISPGGIRPNEETVYEICPNDLTKMERETWEHAALILGKRLEEMHREKHPERIKEWAKNEDNITEALAIMKVGRENGDKARRIVAILMADILFRFFGMNAADFINENER